MELRDKLNGIRMEDLKKMEKFYKGVKKWVVIGMVQIKSKAFPTPISRQIVVRDVDCGRIWC
jgi:hypothetical protein